MLRVHDEPCELVSDRDVHQRIVADPARYVAFVRERLRRIARGDASYECPDKAIFTDASGGDFRVMPCVMRDGDAMSKTVKVVGTNVVGRKVPDQITVGKVLQLDPDENFVTHVVDGCLFSSARTGACATLALEQLGGVPRTVGIIGAGRVGFYSALCLAAAGAERIILDDAIESRALSVCDALRELSVPATAATRQTVLATEALVVATTAKEPFLAPGDTQAQAVISTGADIVTQRELTDEWPAQADLYTETQASLRVGDLAAWQASGLLHRAPTELCELVRHGRCATARRSVFISTGWALFDNLTMRYLVS